MITIYTIGYTQKSAEKFFNLLKRNNITKLIDIRISNSSQLAGFAKGKDLPFFLKKICDISYVHKTDLAPTKQLLDMWHCKKVTWSQYEEIYINILVQRSIIEKYKIDAFDKSCLLCSEATPEQCHRRLLAEFLKKNNSGKEVKIVHLE